MASINATAVVPTVPTTPAKPKMTEAERYLQSAEKKKAEMEDMLNKAKAALAKKEAKAALKAASKKRKASEAASDSDAPVVEKKPRKPSVPTPKKFFVDPSESQPRYYLATPATERLLTWWALLHANEEDPQDALEGSVPADLPKYATLASVFANVDHQHMLERLLVVREWAGDEGLIRTSRMCASTIMSLLMTHKAVSIKKNGEYAFDAKKWKTALESADIRQALADCDTMFQTALGVTDRQRNAPAPSPRKPKEPATPKSRWADFKTRSKAIAAAYKSVDGIVEHLLGNQTAHTEDREALEAIYHRLLKLVMSPDMKYTPAPQEPEEDEEEEERDDSNHGNVSE